MCDIITGCVESNRVKGVYNFYIVWKQEWNIVPDDMEDIIIYYIIVHYYV